MVLALLKRFWPYILLGLVVAAICWQIDSIVDERDDALRELASRDEALATEKGRVKALTEQGLQQVKKRDEQYLSDLEAIKNVHAKETGNDKITISNLRTKLANELRKQTLRSGTNSAKDDATQFAKDNGYTTPLGQSEESVEFYRNAYLGATDYIESLEAAGAVCAADFNACRLYVDDENARLGVEVVVE